MRDDFENLRISDLRAAVQALQIPCADKRSRRGLVRALSSANCTSEQVAAFSGGKSKAVESDSALLSSQNFVALDFETANRYRNSACAISVVRVEDGNIVETFSRLIKPPQRHFEFTFIHGISEDDVADAPEYHEIHEEILRMMDGVGVIAAHNAPFDKSVMNALCAHWGLPVPSVPWECTVKLARKKWNLSSAKLPVVCEHLGIFLKHHDAMSDATACAKIVLAARSGGCQSDLVGSIRLK